MSYETELSYRRSAIEGASPIGLVIALYDTLWGDLRRAAEALRKKDIETRCKELHHGFMVLGQLESWVAPENGGDLADSLTQFYRYLRAKMLEASVSQSANTLEELMDLILHVRSAWQQRDTAATPITEASAVIQSEGSMALATQRIALSFSA